MRYLLLIIFLILCQLLLASEGPGIPLPRTSIPRFLSEISLPSVDSSSIDLISDERTALKSRFAVEPAIIVDGLSDDVRRIGELLGGAARLVDSLNGMFDELKANIGLVDNFVGNSRDGLPVGIKRRVGNTDIYFAVREARLMPDRAEADVYVMIDIPDEEQDPIFEARNIGWSSQGGFAGEIELDLIADWGIDINAGKSRILLKKRHGTSSGCFVRMDCDGFVAGQIEGTILFSRDWVLPVVENEVVTDAVIAEREGNAGVLSSDRVKTEFTFSLEEGFSALIEANIFSTFVFTRYEDIFVEVGNVALDLSDTRNPTYLEFPEHYTSPHVIDGSALPTWKGFYLGGIHVTVPEQFRGEGRESLEVEAPYVIIDQMGFTTHLEVDNLLPLGEKTADGWAFAVDSLELKITANQIEKAKLTGYINIPLLARSAANCSGEEVNENTALSEDDCLFYRAVIQPDNHYAFGVESTTDYCVDVWKANLVITENSRLDLAYSDGSFLAEAHLNGAINVDANIGASASFRMDNLTFQDVVLRNQSPFFEPGTWGFPSTVEASIGDFTLGFSNISLSVDSTATENAGRNCALNFIAYVELDGEFDLDAKGAFRLTGTLDEVGGRQHWRFKKLKVDAIEVRASTSAFEVEATVAFYRDNNDWGTGFYGRGLLRIHALGGAGVAAVAQFGSKNENKYFFVDILAIFPGEGIPVAPGINLLAAGGGVYKGMTRGDIPIQSFDAVDDSLLEEADAAVAIATANNDPLTGIVGRSVSNQQYIVNPATEFGIFVQVVISGPNPDAFSVNARLELEIQTEGGWRASLEGNVTIMGPPNFTNNTQIEKGMAIFVEMHYINSTAYTGFVAKADVYADIGGGVIVGSSGATPESEGNEEAREEFVNSTVPYAGGVALEFSDRRWYVHIGFPEQPVISGSSEVEMTMDIGLAEIKTRTYFLIGEDVPPIPNLPPRVTAIAGELNLSRDNSELETASGFAFGAHLELTSEQEFGIFYWDIIAGVGLDINVRQYGNMTCAGRPGQIGIGGWYGMGQAYAYVEGEVGVRAPTFLGGARFPIISAGVAAVLQVKAPNPLWGRAVLAGEYSVLGGLVSGDFSLETEFGDDCTLSGPEGEGYESIEMITSISPDDEATGIVPGAVPTVYLFQESGRWIEAEGRQYRLESSTSTLIRTADGVEIPGYQQVPYGSVSYKFKPEDYLDAETEYRFTAKVELWARDIGAITQGTRVHYQEKNHTFTTGENSGIIDRENVAYSYPLDGQVNFYTEEYPTGYVALRRGQPDVVDNVTAVFQIRNGGLLSSSASYDDGAKRFEFPIPPLLNGKQYHLELIRDYEPSGGGGGGETNNGGNTSGGPNGNFDPPLPSFTGTQLYDLYFRTSDYGTFTEKMDELLPDLTGRAGKFAAQVRFTSGEGWGPRERGGSDGITANSFVTILIDESETWTARMQAKPKLFDRFPMNSNSFPPTPPAYSGSWLNAGVWSSAKPEIPYDAVWLTSSIGESIPSVSRETFEGGALPAIDLGGGLSFGFGSAIMDISKVWVETARDWLDDNIVQMRDNLLDTDAAGDELRDCVVALKARIDSEVDNPSGDDCGFPDEIIDLHYFGLSPERFIAGEEAFQIEIKYRTPGGLHTRTLNRTITLVPRN